MSSTRLIPVLACLLALTACGAPSATPTGSANPTVSASPTASASPTPTASVPVSDSLDAIKVAGKQLTLPKVSVKAPFAIDETRVQVLDQGKGEKALADSFVTVHYYGAIGRTGKKFEDSYSTKTPATFPLGQVIPGFTTGLAGQRAGSRVLIAMPGADAYDANPTNGPEGYQVGDTLIFVADILSVSVAEPSGKVVQPASGLPKVSDGTGKPAVTIPAGNPPAKMVVQPLIEGTGDKVTKSDTIIARYVGYSWKTGQVIDDQFDTPSTGLLTSTIPGWQTGLVDVRVGSRVLLVLPPESGFPEGSNNPPVEKGDAVVYVIDLLFAYAGG